MEAAGPARYPGTAPIPSAPCSPRESTVRRIARLLLLSLALPVTPARALEASVTPWFAWGTHHVSLHPQDESNRGTYRPIDVERTAGGLELRLPGRHLLASLDRWVVTEPGGWREVAVTAASAGLLLVTDDAGRTHWDQGLTAGFVWPDPWDRHSVHPVLRWRISSTTRIAPLVGVDLAAGMQFDTATYDCIEGLFVRGGLRLGSWSKTTRDHRAPVREN